MAALSRTGRFRPPVIAGMTAILVVAFAGTAASGDRDNGKRVYRRACATCHGYSGDGKGPAARYLDPLPRDFTNGVYKFRSTESGHPPTDQDLVRTITRGVGGTMMPAFEAVLNERDSRDVAAYIKTFSSVFATSPEGAPIEIPEPPQANRDTIDEGRSIFMTLACWTCHGARGRGDGIAGASLKDIWGNDIRPANLTSPHLRSGSEVTDVYRTIMTGLDGTPMVSFAQSFAFPGGSFGGGSMYADSYSASDIEALKTYVESQPDPAQWDLLSDAEKASIISRRKWALAYYVYSLSREGSVLRDLFTQDTELTR